MSLENKTKLKLFDRFYNLIVPEHQRVNYYCSNCGRDIFDTMLRTEKLNYCVYCFLAFKEGMKEKNDVML